jgi:hypothetical protein
LGTLPEVVAALLEGLLEAVTFEVAVAFTVEAVMLLED